MNGEYNTPIGTPVVIAPGKIPLLGEYAVLEDGNAVLAAITRHAKAQFVPRMDTMPSMVSEVVKLAKDSLGEVSAALPPGSVQVNTDDFHQGLERSGFGTSAATAVAAVGAVLESLGLAIEDQKPQILAIADAARRTIQGDLGSGADLAAATHGGLIRIIRQKETAPRIERLTAPAGLHVVLFSVSQSIATAVVLEGVQQYAKHQPAAFGHSMDDLRDIASRFVDEVVGENATGVVVAAGRYGEQLAKLAAKAGVPILTDAFTQASELARALGGIAKPTGAGGGKVGVAIFATPEAARLFRRACPPPVKPLDGDLDCLGVRCQGDDGPEMPEVVSLYQSSTFEAQPTREVAAVVCPSEDADTEPVPAAEGARAASAQSSQSLDDLAWAATDDKVSTVSAELDSTVLDDATSPQLDEELMREESSSSSGDKRRRRKHMAGGAAAALALIVLGWLVISNPLRDRARAERVVPRLMDDIGLVNVASPSPAKLPTRTAGPPTAEVDQASVGDKAPAPQTDDAAAPPTPAHLAGRRAHKASADRTVGVGGAASQKHPPSIAHVPGKAASPRAGKLSPDDF